MKRVVLAILAVVSGSTARSEELKHICGFDHVTRDGDHLNLYFEDWNMAGPGYGLKKGKGSIVFTVSNKLVILQSLGKSIGKPMPFLPVFKGDVVQAFVIDGSCEGVVVEMEDKSLEFRATASEATLPGVLTRSIETIPLRN